MPWVFRHVRKRYGAANTYGKRNESSKKIRETPRVFRRVRKRYGVSGTYGKRNESSKKSGKRHGYYDTCGKRYVVSGTSGKCHGSSDTSGRRHGASNTPVHTTDRPPGLWQHLDLPADAKSVGAGLLANAILISHR
jgi:hypothetical protein